MGRFRLFQQWQNVIRFGENAIDSKIRGQKCIPFIPMVSGGSGSDFFLIIGHEKPLIPIILYI